MKTLLFSLLTTCLLPTLGLAATIIESDFDSNSVSGTTASSITWTTGSGVSMDSSGNLISLNSYSFRVLGNLSTGDNITINSNLNTNQSIQRRFFFDHKL